jgi:hypothetical protein
MPRFDNDLLDVSRLSTEIARAGEISHLSVDSTIRSAWNQTKLEALYELAFLRVFAAWEVCQEGIFFRSLCGYASRAVGQEITVSGTYYRSLAAAERAVLGTRTFLLWHNPNHVINRCCGNIVRGPLGTGPCRQESVITSNLARLEYFSHTRHRIVHDQSDAKVNFDNATRALAGRTYPSSRPGKFLRDRNPLDPLNRKWLEIIANELGGLLSQMV